MSTSRILIVEDEIIIGRELESRLISLGYEVVGIASSGREAIRLAEQTQPSLVLMDIVLKGDMDGIEAATEIRQRCSLPVIYLTAYTDENTLKRAKVTEPFGYIVKPFSERELRANIEMALYKHQVECRAQKVEMWFASAIEPTATAVIATDQDGVIKLINPSAEKLTEFTRQEAIGKRLEEILRLLDTRTNSPLSLQEALAQGFVVCLGEETILVGRQGAKRPVDFTLSHLRNASGKSEGLIAVFRDVLGLKRGALACLNADVAIALGRSLSLREMLQACAESMVRNFDAAFARIWTLSDSKTVLELQASAGQYTHLDGPHSRVPVGKFKIGLIAQEKLPHLTNDILNDPRLSDPEWARREGMVAFAGYPLMVGDRVVGVMALFARRPLSDGILEVLASVAHTIALGIEQKRHEEELRKKDEQLRQAQKLEAIGSLAGGVAHDFNNLLTIINGYSEIITSQLPADSPVRNLAREIGQAGERAASLTRQLLAFSRKQVLEPKVLNLNAEVTDTAKMLKRLIGEDVELNIVLEPGLGRVKADPGQVEQILINLAVNARDAMPQGGKLTIETADVELDQTYTDNCPGLRPGPYVMLAVSDNGCGMDEATKARIFEPFFTTKGPGKGTGLGLATVYGIVKQSEGHIAVYSEPGRGTTFKIYLPAVATEQLSGKSHPGLQVVRHGTETILLTEDEPAVLALARHVLEMHGYTVLEASNPEKAIRIAEAHKGTIHLLVTDVVMPALSGRQLVERLAALRPGMKVLYLSGYTDDAVVRHGVLQEQTAFLQKPFTTRALAQKVREVLDE